MYHWAKTVLLSRFALVKPFCIFTRNSIETSTLAFQFSELQRLWLVVLIDDTGEVNDEVDVDESTDDRSDVEDDVTPPPERSVFCIHLIQP